MNKSEIAEKTAHELTTLDRHPEMRGRGPGCLCADCENARKLIVERAIAESRASQPDRAARRGAFQEVENFIAANGRNADIQSFVEKKICGLE